MSEAGGGGRTREERTRRSARVYLAPAQPQLAPQLHFGAQEQPLPQGHDSGAALAEQPQAVLAQRQS
jgi:hypothetical protein